MGGVALELEVGGDYKGWRVTRLDRPLNAHGQKMVWVACKVCGREFCSSTSKLSKAKSCGCAPRRGAVLSLVVGQTMGKAKFTVTRVERPPLYVKAGGGVVRGMWVRCPRCQEEVLRSLPVVMTYASCGCWQAVRAKRMPRRKPEADAMDLSTFMPMVQRANEAFGTDFRYAEAMALEAVRFAANNDDSR